MKKFSIAFLVLGMVALAGQASANALTRASNGAGSDHGHDDHGFNDDHGHDDHG